MRKFLKAFGAAVVGVGLLAAPSIASAQEVTLRVEPGVAVPLTKPQSDRFDVGGAGAVKPELTLGHYLGVGPVVQVLALPSNVPGVDTGTAWSYGGFLRLKRPHDELNTGRGFSAISPWVDADLKYVRTDGLDRLGTSVAIGAQVPTSDSRWLWVGPFARYDLVSQEDGKIGVNTNSAKTAIFGVSFEFGAPQKKKEVAKQPAPPPPPPAQPPAEQPKKPEPPPAEKPVVQKLELKQRVQFALDSTVLRPSENKALEEVTKALLANKDYNVQVEGHACILGSAAHNDKLSQRRAQAVVDYLVAHGVDRNRLTAKGFGNRVPVADNKTEAGRVANRRVEFDVTFVLVKEGK